VRVRFIEQSDGPRQADFPQIGFDLFRSSMSALSRIHGPRAESWMMGGARSKPVDLLTGPLWVCALFKAAPETLFLVPSQPSQSSWTGSPAGCSPGASPRSTPRWPRDALPEEGTFGPLEFLP